MHFLLKVRDILAAAVLVDPRAYLTLGPLAPVFETGGHLHREGQTENSWKFNKFSATHRQFSSKGLKVFVFDLVNCGRHICCVQILSFSVFQFFLFGKAIFRIDHVARLTKKRRTVPCWWNYPPAKGSTWNGSISRLFVLFVFALHGSVRIGVNEPPFNFLEAQGL